MLITYPEYKLKVGKEVMSRTCAVRYSALSSAIQSYENKIQEILEILLYSLEISDLTYLEYKLGVFSFAFLRPNG